MTTVYKKTAGLQDTELHYCPGCSHGIVHKLIGEVMEELGIIDSTICVCPVGCSVFAGSYFACDAVEAAHGRAPAAATGLKAGETKEFKLTFPVDYGAKNLAGKIADFTLTVKKVQEPVLPALDDKFAESLGIKSVDQLKKEVETNLKREVKSRLTARTKEGVFNALIEQAKFALPVVMVRDEAARIGNEYRETLAARGLDVKNMPNLDPQVFAPQAERRVRLGLLVSKLIADNKIKAEPEQVKAFAAEMASAYEKPEEVTEWYLKDQNRYAELSAAVIENNLVDFVLGKGKTSDEAIDFDVLMGRKAEA